MPQSDMVHRAPHSTPPLCEREAEVWGGAVLVAATILALLSTSGDLALGPSAGSCSLSSEWWIPTPSRSSLNHKRDTDVTSPGGQVRAGGPSTGTGVSTVGLRM